MFLHNWCKLIYNCQNLKEIVITALSLLHAQIDITGMLWIAKGLDFVLCVKVHKDEKRIRNKMMNNPGRYKLHQYLKYAHQWADTVSYKCRLYLILDNGKIVKTD